MKTKMKSTLSAIALLVAFTPLLTWADDDNASSMAAIAAIGEAYIKAFDAGDAKAVAAFWTPDGDYINQSGRIFKGREAIEKDFAAFFSENKGAKLGIDSESLAFPVSGTAIEDGTTFVQFADAALPARARYSNVFVKQDGRWLLASVRESNYIPPTNATHLQGLAWMLGEWVGDAPGGEVSRVLFEWSPDGNFLLSRHAITVGEELLSTGTQTIAWDPATSEIRSWNFESDGGFGEGAWTADKGAWSIQTNSTLPDGKKLVATNSVARNIDGSITWQSTSRTLDGKPLPDTDKLIFKPVR